VAAALLAGCGGDSSAPIEPVGGDDGGNGNGGSVALSKSAVIEQGDAICGEANAALASLDRGATGNDPEVKASQELQITRSELDSLQSLTPPQQERSTLHEFLAALEDEVVALAHKKAALDQGGDTAFPESDASIAESNAEAAAESYGFKECGSGGHAPATTATETTTPAPAAPTTATTTPTTPTTTPTTPVAPANSASPPATGGAGGAASGGATGGGATGGGTGGTGGSGGVSP
jgi:hypothetical protein